MSCGTHSFGSELIAVNPFEQNHDNRALSYECCFTNELTSAFRNQIPSVWDSADPLPRRPWELHHGTDGSRTPFFLLTCYIIKIRKIIYRLPSHLPVQHFQQRFGMSLSKKSLYCTSDGRFT